MIAPPQTISLLEYVSCGPGAHTGVEVAESMDKLTLTPLGGFDKHVFSRIALPSSTQNWDLVLDWGNPKGLAGFH